MTMTVLYLGNPPCVTNSVRIEFLTVSNENVRNVTNTMLEILWDTNVTNIC